MDLPLPSLALINPVLPTAPEEAHVNAMGVMLSPSSTVRPKLLYGALQNAAQSSFPSLSICLFLSLPSTGSVSWVEP